MTEHSRCIPTKDITLHLRIKPESSSLEVPMINRGRNNKNKNELGLPKVVSEMANDFNHFARVLATQLTPSFHDYTVKTIFLQI